MPNLLLLAVVWPGVATRRQGHLGGDGREDAHSHFTPHPTFTMNLARLRLMPERHKRLQVLESPATLVLAGTGCVVESHTHTGEAQLSIFTRGGEQVCREVGNSFTWPPSSSDSFTPGSLK